MSGHIPHLEFLYTRFLTCLLESFFFLPIIPKSLDSRCLLHKMSVRLFLRFGWDAFQAFLSQPPASLVFLQNILLLFSVSAVISFPYAAFSSRIQWPLSFDAIYFFFKMIFFLSTSKMLKSQNLPLQFTFSLFLLLVSWIFCCS